MANLPNFRDLAAKMNTASPVSITQAYWRTLFSQVLTGLDDQLWKVPALLGDGTPIDARRLLGLEHVAIEYNSRGEWQPNTDYDTNDLVWHENTAYGALVSHHSGPDFGVDYSAGRWRILGGSLLDALLSDTRNRAFVVVITGQSNAVGAHDGGPNPANPLVKTWDPATGTWGSSDYTMAPWSYGAPRGNGGNNNIGLSLAHRLADTFGARVYVIYDAVGGRPISDWIADGVNSVRYAAIKAKVEAALASPELAVTGKSAIDYLIFAQGEEDDLTDDPATYRAKFATLDGQFRAESWMTNMTPMLVMGMSGLHWRYRVGLAQIDYCENVNSNCVYVNSAGLKTGYDVDPTNPDVDYTHWLGPSLWEAGYHRCWYALQSRGMSHRYPMAPFYARATGTWRGESIALAQFDSLCSYGSTTAQFPMNGPAASYAIHWGYQCSASNYSMAGGYQVTMTTGSNYSIGWGRLNTFAATAQYSAAFGYGNAMNAPYTFSAGRGHTVADQYGAAVGSFSEYATALADPVRFQVGIGTALANPKSGLTVFQSGRVLIAGNLDFRSDNAYSVGTPSARASVIYAATGSINTSDATTKKVRGALDEAELRAWATVQPVVYRLLDSIEEKGEEAARLHAGLIAQDVQAAFIAQGLDPTCYALFCENEIFEEDFDVRLQQVERQKTGPGVVREVVVTDGVAVEIERDVDDALQFDQVPLVDESGKEIIDQESGRPVMVPVPIMETVDIEVRVPVRRSIGKRYGLRYTECLIFEAAYQRARVDRLEARMAALEGGTLPQQPDNA